MRALFEFDQQPLLFASPRSVIVCHDPQGLMACFDVIEKALADGYYAAGFLSYEAGYALEPALKHLKGDDFPLLCFGIFDAPKRERPSLPASGSSVHDIACNISKDDYTRNIARIHDHIRDGDVYQITYCLKQLFRFEGDPYHLYRMLLKHQPVPYPAYIETDRYKIISLSPEMFVKKNGQHLVTKPMKGSWPRGGFINDALGRWLLEFSSKNRAENVMIADLLRNDLGRIARLVRTPRLFEVARYNTIYQMTSTVRAEVDRDLPLADLFKAIFPSGSVTGAPKVKAMGIIHGLEGEPRRIYTGAIGWITPEKDLYFNVPIRTILLKDKRGELGIGGGIVWDSTADGEWDEGLWKARFLQAATA
jgi:para-aminobenzoate synthetase/4-amino-4-deoxychorismate lyase